MSIVVQRDPEALDCPDSGELTSQVERILQRPMSDPGAPSGRLQITVRFSRTRDGYAAELTFVGPKQGERVLQDQGKQCGALAQAVSVTLALFLDKELDEQRSASDPAPAPEKPVPAPAPTNLPGREQVAPRADAKQWQMRAGLAGGAGWFAASGPQAILGLDLGVRAEPWSFDLGLAEALPAASRFSSGEVSTYLLLGTAKACYRFGAQVRFGPCAAFGLGSLRGRGSGFAEVRSVGLLWSAVGAGVELEGDLGPRFFFGTSGVGWWPTRRQTFSVENAGVAWRSAAFAGTLLLHLGARLW